MSEKYLLPSPKEILARESSKQHKHETTLWTVYASSKRILKDWHNLVINNPEETIACYKAISSAPMQRIRGVAFAMKGKTFKGGWEYKVNKGDRVFYQPIKDTKEVIVYYADKHPKEHKYPTPPS